MPILNSKFGKLGKSGDVVAPPDPSQQLCHQGFGGGSLVIRPDHSIVRICDLAADNPHDMWHELLGPNGIEKVRIRICGFGERSFSVYFKNLGYQCKFTMTHPVLQLNDKHALHFGEGMSAVLRGKRIIDDQLVDYDIQCGQAVPVKVHHYYTHRFTPCNIYIGANQKLPTFLPFILRSEVLPPDHPKKQSIWDRFL